MKKKFSGVVVPMVTPLLTDYTIDVDAVEKLIGIFAQHNIHPLVLGTTGESSSFSEYESLRLVEMAVKNKGENQVIYAGLVGNQVDELISRGRKYIDLGADCVVATLPSYYVLNPKQMEKFYLMLADEIPGPVMMYNIKATTQMSLPLDVVEKLSYHAIF